MNFIQFGSLQKKDNALQDLKETQERMLDDAKERILQRTEHETKSCLKGDNLKEKIKKKNKQIKHSKRKQKKIKKLKKKPNKKRKYSSSGEKSYSSDNSSSSDFSSDVSKSEKLKKFKKNYKRHENKKNKLMTGTDSEVEKTKWVMSNFIELNKSEEPLKRDSWMTGSLLLKTYSRDHRESKLNERLQIDAYDPVKSSRELNPYWKRTGTGLPVFQKPQDGNEGGKTKMKSLFSQSLNSSKRWKKQDEEKIDFSQQSNEEKFLPSHRESGIQFSNKEDSKEKSDEKSGFLTDQQMNELGAKILKAEIMGNMSLAAELRHKLEKSRYQRNILKSLYNECNNNPTTSKDNTSFKTKGDQNDETLPLTSCKYSVCKEKKRIKTHNETGEIYRYFANDDGHDLKQMFEEEKYANASDRNWEFANIAKKMKNSNVDVEDIFMENICRDITVRSERKGREQAIRAHQKLEATLNKCDKCFDSNQMQKELLVCVGENVYLSLPWYQGLQQGHCMIIPNQHATCCTQIDDDVWKEINEFRKSLARMFAAQKKDVIFYEIANRLHKRQHLTIHCIPIPESDGEMAPFYFKKAIEESEHVWCINKQLVTLREKSLRNSIPKGMPYFWVNFGMDTGFAHVIEDEERFPPNFAQEIIGGMLNLDVNKWRRLQREQNITTKVKLFADWWKSYNCTK